MAKLGDIYIGGYEIPQNTPQYFPCGVVFSLDNKSEINQMTDTTDLRWQIEIKQGYSSVIVRSRDLLNYDDAIKYGFEQAQRFLDLLAVKKIGIFNIKSPETNNISVYYDKSNNLVLRHFSIGSLSFSTNAFIEVRDKNGNIKPSPPIPEPKWTWGFRYYRLSQYSQNIFEAYRNLFLSFEAILNEICPKQTREREGRWLKRALHAISTRIDYSHYVPSGVSQSIEHLFQTQYTDVRCRLFHANFPYAMLPQSELNPTEVLTAYDVLIRLWQDIAQKYFDVPSKGGVFTYQGFKWLMDKAFSKKLSICFTEDDSIPEKEDTAVSPLGKDIFFFKEVSYLSQTQPGFVSWQGRLSSLDLCTNKKIHRICTKLDDTLLNVVFIDEGLISIGVDIFESYESISLLNKSQPKTRF